MNIPLNFDGRIPKIDPSDAAMLLIDHQSGLFQIVKDIPLLALRANVTALAKAATAEKIPVITSASVPQGPNGPLIPEVHQFAPHAQYIARRGEVNVWDNPDFVAAVKATKRKTLIIAGTLTSVCLAFPCLSAVHEGYRVFAVIDASGSVSQMATDVTVARLTQVGVVPIDTMAVLAELQKSWSRPNAMEWAQVYSGAMPHYQLLIESYQKAQQVAREGELMDSQR
ncbi:isochorismatase family protein [Nitrosomonas sp. Is37]|uniref:isochorismatase family protein n=1 Tax=Nitrosomonas sp. Is37 TaxID=3080535 RepID=UPI00294B917C|nr:isochorismatase family protein [Nitrosomonas sp. Is37]MDV6344607.1 isochorismatase family protein [Nitrosomonas sp. Is37]